MFFLLLLMLAAFNCFANLVIGTDYIFKVGKERKHRLYQWGDVLNQAQLMIGNAALALLAFIFWKAGV